ncbi:MAG: tyrosine--tRNA ligase [Candidatus Yanofskybacteria bacterium RIFCSPLOWO2_01_FULL_49_25]|uniref:Tyrosine--tRNA ligase n=1 Tax=Candidatus Yanofskybacteria bacterium RIFCSPLOWO2_01_FULL_49_25 TaxID=1802701 RepID=A0A1F8GWJ0_9BACT|nr:MAG: tyrosine--tRNA ligase [Candidatus Yanofskybacteria bacterium RIFCSPLOWO2_01_FULL_49_25]
MNTDSPVERIFHPAVLANAYPDPASVKKRLLEEKGLVFYYGIDPTGPDVHLGHIIQLLLLKRLIQLGHKAILLIGDFTAQIGDPTDKDAARKPLSLEEIEKNLATYMAQVEKILEPGSFELKHNRTWLAPLTFIDILKLAGHFTVQQMEERDMFQRRRRENKPIGLHEFLYPLMQGYDAVAMDADGEIGGNDQTFNMLVGRDLQQITRSKDMIVITTRMLADRSGKKMSKSEGSLIAISDSPEVVYEKVMNTIPDDMVPSVFEMCTEVPLSEIKDEINREQHEKLAFELTRMFHSQEAAERARNVFSETSQGEHIKEMKLEHPDLITRVIVGVYVKTVAEASALIKQGVVWKNGELLKKAEQVGPGDEVRIGKRIRFKIV